VLDSLKAWFESLDADSHLFKNADDELIHTALASVLYHIIKADGEESDKEKRRFFNIMNEEFSMTETQCSNFYGYLTSLKSDLKTDLHTVSEYLKNNPQIRMSLMNKLNQLIIIDGTSSKELEIFYEAMKAIFPEVEINE